MTRRRLPRHARTKLAGDLDSTVAVLTQVSAACDRYVDRLRELLDRRIDLAEEKSHLDDEQADFARRAASYEPDEEAGLKSEAAALDGRIEAFVGRVDAWQTQMTSNEDTLIAAFRAVDTVSEGAAVGEGIDVSTLAEQAGSYADDPQGANLWWKSLSAAEREALMVERPELIGQLNGIPVEDRDGANRAGMEALESTLGEIKADGELTDEQSALMTKIDNTQLALDKPQGIDPNTKLPISPTS